MTTPDLFTSSGVEVRDPRREPVSLRRAARLLASRVEALVYYDGEHFPARARVVARRAEIIGAHSVARAVRWYAHPETVCERHGWEQSSIRLERVARRFLERVERESTP